MTIQATLFDGVRERATAFGSHVLSDAETLELFLSRALPGSAGRVAGDLLATYGDLVRVLAQPHEALAARIGNREAATDLKALHDVCGRIFLAPLMQRDVINSWSALLDYVNVKMRGRGRECFRVLFLDKKNQLLADEIMNEGTVDHAPVYPREIVRRALELDASSIILVHNHPSGDPTPSAADIDMTRQVIDACKALRITVHDHLVVGAEGTASFKALGLI